MAYRSWKERKSIIRAIIADGDNPTLDSFKLTEEEARFFRSRADAAILKIVKSTSVFKSNYSVIKKDLFLPTIILVSFIIAASVTSGILLFYNISDANRTAPIVACVTAAVAALGWGVTSSVSHANSVRQNTTNLLFARFSQSAYKDSIHTFHKAFGYGEFPLVTLPEVRKLQASSSEEDQKSAASVFYVLNYFEFISAGIHKGEIDINIVRDHMRGTFIYYFDKCIPLINDCNKQNRKSAEYFIKVTSSFREP
ncbi:DUF4760 domain-containing protein [Brevundimonas sp. KM4]|uniref:DUF4760 domain-containing protein n=1 Tax=Brevundimonas sp. KM4 TaxID=1628191 RepID=UPI0009E56833|nr:DUF4760 domain-containing protein [Brevundimonas sp. KM4]